MRIEAERRYLSADQGPVDVSTRSDGKKVISGYSAVFYRKGEKGTEYRLWEDLVERIRPGAFDRAIKEKHDVRALFNHDPNNLLGRSTNGTCKYSVDKIGLKYEITVDPNDSDHQRVVAKIERGDLTGSSFAFRPTKVTWEENKDADSVRYIDDLNLYDVGPVTYPAYEASTTGLRAEDGRAHVEEDYRLWKETLAMSNEVRTEDEVKPSDETSAGDLATADAGRVTEEAPVEETRTADKMLVELCERFGVLETQVREALAMLAAEKNDAARDDEDVDVQDAAGAAVDNDTEVRDAAQMMEMRRRQLALAELCV